MSGSMMQNNSNPMSFTENQHGNVVLERLRLQRESGRFCDVILVVHGRQFSAHRNILAACSPYFDSILKMHKVVKEQVTVNCLNSDVFELLLNYMYSGSVVIDRNNVMELLKLANNFLVTKLKNYCAEYLDRYLDAANCLTVKVAAEKYNMPGLAKNACLFLETNINRVLMESTDILGYPLRRIETIFADSNYEISPEVQLRFILKWVSLNVGERESHFKQLLSHVSLARIDRTLLSRLLDTDSLCETSEPCRFALLQAMYENSIPLQAYETQYQSLLAKYSGEVNVYLNTASTNGPISAQSEKSNRASVEEAQNARPSSSRPPSQDNGAGERRSPDEFKPGPSGFQGQQLHQPMETSQTPVIPIPTTPLTNGPVPQTNFVCAEPVPLNSTSTPAIPGSGQSSEFSSGYTPARISFLPPVLHIKKEVMDPVLDGPSDGQNNLTSNFDMNSPNSGNHSTSGGTVIGASGSTMNHSSGYADSNGASMENSAEMTNHLGNGDSESVMGSAGTSGTIGHRPPLKLTLKLPSAFISSKKSKILRKYNKQFQNNLKPKGRPPKYALGQPEVYLPLTSEEVSDPDFADPASAEKAQVIFKCPHCVYKSNCQSRIQAHIEKAHCRNRIYVCNLCNYECKWNREYYMHMKQHFQGPPFRCDTCDYTAERIQMLLTHRMKHTDERPYKCTECDYRCRTKTNLVAHARSHTGEKPFSCPECGRGFAIKSTLDQHLATHSDTRPFQCDQCSFSTKYQSHLISHKRIHTGDVFHCQFTDCSYSSPKKSQLAAHLRTHLAVRAHSCKICGRAFIEKSHLVRHERIHLAEKPFKCDNCEYASSRRDKLKEHIQKHHSMQPGSRGPYRQRRHRRAKQLAAIAAAQAQANASAMDNRSQMTPGSSHSESGSLLGEASGFRPITPARNGVMGAAGGLDHIGHHLDINSLLSPSPLLNRPSSAIFPSAGNHVMQPSPALSLNFNLDFSNDGSAPSVNKDVLLSTQVAPTPGPLLSGSPQSTTNSLQSDPFPSSNTPTGELLQRPMSLPPLGGQPSNNWSSQFSDFSFTAMF